MAAAEQRDELTPFPLTEMHPIPSRAGSTWQDIGSGTRAIGEPQGSLGRIRASQSVMPPTLRRLVSSAGHSPTTLHPGAKSTIRAIAFPSLEWRAPLPGRARHSLIGLHSIIRPQLYLRYTWRRRRGLGGCLSK